MKRFNLLFLVALLTGCGTMPSGSASSSKFSDTQYVRNAGGQTVYRITDSSVFTPNGTRVARIDSNGNVFNTSGSRVAKITKR